MDEHADSWGGDGCAVEVVVAVDLGPCREVGVDAGSSHEIQS